MDGGDRFVRLASLCAAAAAGRGDALHGLTTKAMAAGCSAGEIREALLTLVPFCGFPRALDAFAAIRPVLGAQTDSPDRGASATRGAAFFDLVYGRDAAKVRANLAALDAGAAAWIESDAYGRVLSRPGISASLRERIGVVLLAAQGLRTQLSGHIRGAMNCGATAGEIAAFVDAAAPFIDPAELEFARAALRRVAAEGR